MTSKDRLDAHRAGQLAPFLGEVGADHLVPMLGTQRRFGLKLRDRDPRHRFGMTVKISAFHRHFPSHFKNHSTTGRAKFGCVDLSIASVTYGAETKP
jgi:hypothetical protein